MNSKFLENLFDLDLARKNKKVHYKIHDQRMSSMKN